MVRSFRSLILFIALSLLTSNLLFAQKQKLEPEDYGQWQYITTTEMSPDGNWFAYNINLVDGDGWLTIKEVGTDSTGTHKFMHGIRPDFSADNRWVAYQIGVSEDEAEKLEEQEKRVHFKLGLMDLSTTSVDTFKNVQSYQFSENGQYLAMRKYKPGEVKTDGTDLILRDLAEGTNQLIGNVSEFAFNDGGSKLAVLLDATEQLGNGAHLYNLESGKISVLDSDTTSYDELAWNEDGTALAFLRARKNEDFKNPTHKIYAFSGLDGSMEKQVFDQQNMSAFPDSFRVVDYRSLYCQKTATRFFSG